LKFARLSEPENQRRPRLITYLNAHCANLSRKDDQYRQALLKHDVIYPDGMSIVWAGRLLGFDVRERLSAGDYIFEFCERAAESGLSLFLLGGYKGMMPMAARTLKRKVPDLNIAGVHHGFFSEDETNRLIEKINRSGADILIVGMSAPVQEIWAVQNREGLACGVIWSVGALMEYVSGRTPRCPRWMARAGMEWLFRLIVEPRRMWRRYLIGNIIFLVNVFRERIRRL
jgi:N-acetylglucosaminyldiphosphoundecaprenol N-acetyl-beta-D-mannosaminyltransferase